MENSSLPYSPFLRTQTTRRTRPEADHDKASKGVKRCERNPGELWPAEENRRRQWKKNQENLEAWMQNCHLITGEMDVVVTADVTEYREINICCFKKKKEIFWENMTYKTFAAPFSVW